MRKKKLYQFLSLSLVAAMMISSAPVGATTLPPAETAEIQVDSEANTEIETETNVITEATKVITDTDEVTTEVKDYTEAISAEAEEIIVAEDVDSGEEVDDSGDLKIPDAPDLFTLDVKKDAVGTLKDYILSNDDANVAAWYFSLSDADKKTVVKRVDMFRQDFQINTDYCKECGIIAGEYKTYLDYLEKVAACGHKIKASVTASSGYFTVNIYKESALAAAITVKASGFVKGGSTKDRVKDGITWSISGGGNYMSLQEGGFDRDYGCGSSYTWAAEASPDNYNTAGITANILKPAGWYYSNHTESAYGTSRFTLVDRSVITKPSAGILSIASGGTFTNTWWLGDNMAAEDRVRQFSFLVNYVDNMINFHAVKNFTLSPIPYTYTYRTDGATEGAAQAVGYNLVTGGGVYTAEQLGIKRKITFSYNPNGGTASKGSEILQCPQTSWLIAGAGCPGGTGIANGQQTNDGYWVAGFDGNADLYPQFGAAQTSLPTATGPNVTLSFNSNGGSAVSSQSKNRALAYWQGSNGGQYSGGQAITSADNMSFTAVYSAATFTMPSVSRTGYQFAGWDINGQRVNAGQTVSLQSSATATAVWAANAYTISYDGNGADSGKIMATTCNYNADAVLAKNENNKETESKAFTKEGYHFLGWATTASAVSPSYSEGDTVRNLTESDNITLYAVWAINEATITFDTGDGSFISPVVAKGTEAISLPASQLDGYNFMGWTTVKEKAGKYVGAANREAANKAAAKYPQGTMYTSDMGDITLYAVWWQDDPVPDTIDPTIAEITEKIDKIQSQVDAVKDKLTTVNSTAEMTSTDIAELKSLIKSLTASNSEVVTDRLVDLITSSTKLTEEQKLKILTELASGYLSDETRQMLTDMVKSLNLADEAELLEAIKNISTLTFEQQKAMLSKLQDGSSVEFKAGDGVTYVITKNADGTLSVGIKSLNDKEHIEIPNQISIAGTTYPVTKIAKEAFKDNQVLKTVTIPGNVTTIGTSAFENCSSLEAVNTNKGLMTIGSKAFKGCTSLTQFTCPSTLITIGTSAFEGCTKLKTVTLNNNLLQIKKKAFYKCKALTKISIPKTVLEIGSYAFAKCTKLKTVTFKNYSDSKIKTISSYAFAYDKALTKIKLPKKLTAISKKTFYKCTKLSSVTGMAGVTSIGESAFEGCTKITKITLATKVQTISKRAFYGCKKLKTVTVKTKAITKIGSKAFKGTKKGITFKCPKTKVKSYKKLLKGKY